jgi:tetratricopeptide (TPR) repeat protein
MPSGDSTNVAHIAVTDHRIRRRPDPGGGRSKVLGPGQVPLVAYRPGPHAPADAERDRDLAIALGNECARTGAPPGLWAAVEPRLDRALGLFTADGEAWIARSRVHTARGDGVRAMAAARSAVGLNPDSEVALIQLAAAAMAADDFESAIQAADRLIELNPSSADHRQTRATAHFSRKDWARAEADCRAVLAIQPVRPNARFMLAVCLHRRGDADGGRRELDLAQRLTPAAGQRATLAKWYDQFTR